MSSHTVTSLDSKLRSNPVLRRFLTHGFFTGVRRADMNRQTVSTFLGQWWHPLHFFPTFLAGSVAVLPDINSKTAISRILYQELGCGEPQRAHEVIYGQTIERAGLDRTAIVEAEPFTETSALVAGYRSAATQRLSALGFIFATEVTDLMMVSSIGTAIERVTGIHELEWVNIHLEQEPDHVYEATAATAQGFTPIEEEQIISHAEEMWRLWSAFFDRIEREAEFRPGAVSAAHV